MPTKKRFEPGDRVRDVRHLNIVGTILPERLGTKNPTGYIFVAWDNNVGKQRVPGYYLEKVNPMEELAALGGKTKNNPKGTPLTAPKTPRLRGRLDAGTRVRIDGKDIGTICPDIEQPRNPDYHMVDIEGRGWRCVTRSSLQPLSPVEELALVAKTYKNNPKFRNGDRVKANLPSVKDVIGTIEGEAFGYPSTWQIIVFDNGYRRQVRSEDIVGVSGIEDIAALGKTKKNPKILGALPAGSRVRILVGTWAGIIGTISVQPYSGMQGALYRVLLDTGETRNFYRYDFEAVSPVEEMAAVAKTYKNPAEKLNKEDHVQRLYGPYKSRIGTVTRLRSKPHWSHYGTTEITACVLFDGSRYAVEYPVDMLKKVTPLEELASVQTSVPRAPKTQKNPNRIIQRGDRVFLPQRPKRYGTIVTIAIGGWARVDWDDTGDDKSNYLGNRFEHVPPMEDLAAVAKTYKNPRFKMLDVGERIRHTSWPKLRLGTIQKDMYSASTWYTVAFDDGKTEYLHVSELERPTPLEELAALVRKPR